MVLQQAPKRAQIWGHSHLNGDTVRAMINGQPAGETTVQNGVWKLKLPAQTEHGPFTITATSGTGHLILNDVMFGDVWLCSGQSNMAYPLGHVSIEN
jgi:sialate O-acetylesterase